MGGRPQLFWMFGPALFILPKGTRRARLATTLFPSFGPDSGRARPRGGSARVRPQQNGRPATTFLVVRAGVVYPPKGDSPCPPGHNRLKRPATTLFPSFGPDSGRARPRGGSARVRPQQNGTPATTRRPSPLYQDTAESSTSDSPGGSSNQYAAEENRQSVACHVNPLRRGLSCT